MILPSLITLFIHVAMSTDSYLWHETQSAAANCFQGTKPLLRHFLV